MKTAQIEVDLPMLINHCGKLRMLSHRFVMMLSLCQAGRPQKSRVFAARSKTAQKSRCISHGFIGADKSFPLKGLKKSTARYFVNPALFPAIALDVLCWIGQICAASTPISIM